MRALRYSTASLLGSSFISQVKAENQPGGTSNLNCKQNSVLIATLSITLRGIFSLKSAVVGVLCVDFFWFFACFFSFTLNQMAPAITDLWDKALVGVCQDRSADEVNASLDRGYCLVFLWKISEYLSCHHLKPFKPDADTL